ncbi:MAG TPA: hypothetical protein PKY77_12510, partial [Phycisphaerae bacterium]|nr:hypothetical protein [Phycisphaerae bacterium]HRY70365.1 hypothetical protein [Phycisphaerae bacterium]HSA28082.1 hypothetical protein [Phycisphaerae bacterium]
NHFIGGPLRLPQMGGDFSPTTGFWSPRQVPPTPIPPRGHPRCWFLRNAHKASTFLALLVHVGAARPRGCGGSDEARLTADDRPGDAA